MKTTKQYKYKKGDRVLYKHQVYEPSACKCCGQDTSEFRTGEKEGVIEGVSMQEVFSVANGFIEDVKVCGTNIVPIYYMGGAYYTEDSIIRKL